MYELAVSTTFRRFMNERRPSPQKRVSAHDNSLAPAGAEAWQDERAGLQAAVRARDEFISIAGHELRNPMAAVLLQVQALRKLAQRQAPVAEVEHRLTTLEQRVKSFIGRATTLLDVTRLNANAYRLEREAVALDEALAIVIDELRPQAEHAGSSIDAQIETGLVGQWDRLAVIQVVSNLVSNAIKYGAGKPITVATWRETEVALLRVEDHGIGMSEDDQERVFARFERAVKRRQHGGFGLGLWIVGQLVQRLGGTIELSSANGQGSTFIVRLPLAAPAPTEELQNG